MTTIKLKGHSLNDWTAEQLVKDHGPDAAREKCCGPALEAVERVIASMAGDDEERQFAHAEAEIKTGGFLHLTPCSVARPMIFKQPRRVMASP